jgi:hypothetical protein
VEKSIIMKPMKQAIFKFNSSLGALLCSKCKTIIKIGQEFTPDEVKAIKGEIKLGAQYCNNCKK